MDLMLFGLLVELMGEDLVPAMVVESSLKEKAERPSDSKSMLMV